MVLTYFLNDFEMVPVAPIITGIALVFTFHIRCISIVRSLYVFQNLLSFFLNHIPVSWNCDIYQHTCIIIIIIIIIIKVFSFVEIHSDLSTALLT
jgi:hypothetical protein